MQKASRTQIIRINDILRQHVKKCEGTDLYEYEEGFSDEKISEIVGCTRASVALLRREVFGQLRRPVSAGTTAQYAALEELLHRLIEKHDKLTLLLAVNRVVDCKHLTVTDVGHK